MVNVFLIVLDTLRQDHVGCYGNDWIRTPNLDNFAKDAVRFTRMYPESLPTLPARKALYTGHRCYPFHRHIKSRGDFIGEALGAPGWGAIPDDIDTLAERFQRRKYTSALISDVYHQFKPGYNFQRGFSQWQWIRGQEEDEYLSGPEIPEVQLKSYLTTRKDGVTAGSEFARFMMRSFLMNTQYWKAETDTFPSQVFRAAGQWLDMNFDKLLAGKAFMTVESFDPHEPWIPPPQYIRMYEKDPNWEQGCRHITHSLYGPASTISDKELKNLRTRYAGEVTLVDTWFGYFIEYIKRMGIWDESLIVVVSDHGHMLGEHGLIAKAANPLGREVADLVAMIKFPGREGAGTTCDKFCYHHDIPATIGQTCKLGIEDMAGRDLHKLVFEKDLNYYNHVTIAWGGSVAVYDGEFWYNGYVWDTEGASLYDATKDPKLTHNIIQAHPDKAKALLNHAWDDAGKNLNLDFLRQYKDRLGCTPVTKKLQD